MGRTIDADKFILALMDASLSSVDEDTILDLIDSVPTEGVAPVVHGRWIPFHSTVAGDIQFCSACGIGCAWKPNYCPNCRAKMDGGD